MTKDRFEQIHRDLSRFGFLLHRHNRVISVYCGAPAAILVAENSPDVMGEIRRACEALRPDLGERAFGSLF
jgi:hypothetical protein